MRHLGQNKTQASYAGQRNILNSQTGNSIGNALETETPKKDRGANTGLDSRVTGAQTTAMKDKNTSSVKGGTSTTTTERNDVSNAMLGASVGGTSAAVAGATAGSSLGIVGTVVGGVVGVVAGLLA